eukprot:1181788-Prorocentrum_minimum.AAC.1
MAQKVTFLTSGVILALVFSTGMPIMLVIALMFLVATWFSDRCGPSIKRGERSGRKWGTGQGGEKRGRVSGVLSAPLPLLAQEDFVLSSCANNGKGALNNPERSRSYVVTTKVAHE